MKGYLLDTNLLIALLWQSHEKHDLARAWFTRHRAKGWVTCPFTQAGFVRIVSNPAFSRDAVQPREAVQVLGANTTAKDHAFWPDEFPVSEALAFAGVRLLGHQQVRMRICWAWRSDGVDGWPRWITGSRRSRSPIRQRGNVWNWSFEDVTR
jgi:toxin-antitoxin system PIN domain toxin